MNSGTCGLPVFAWKKPLYVPFPSERMAATVTVTLPPAGIAPTGVGLRDVPATDGGTPGGDDQPSLNSPSDAGASVSPTLVITMTYETLELVGVAGLVVIDETTKSACVFKVTLNSSEPPVTTTDAYVL